MRVAMWMVLGMLGACDGGHEHETGGGGSGGSSGGGSGGSSGGDDSDGPCGEDGLCDVVVSEVVGECGDGSVTTPTLTAAVEGPGEVRVELLAAESGCCPTVEGSAEADLSKGEIHFNYSVTADECDCVCWLDIGMLISEVPAGGWSVMYGTQSVLLTVE